MKIVARPDSLQPLDDLDDQRNRRAKHAERAAAGKQGFEVQIGHRAVLDVLRHRFLEIVVKGLDRRIRQHVIGG